MEIAKQAANRPAERWRRGDARALIFNTPTATTPQLGELRPREKRAAAFFARVQTCDCTEIEFPIKYFPE